MKLNIITLGQPKFDYAKSGWNEYFERLKHYYNLQAIHIADRHNDSQHFMTAADNSFVVALVIEGQQLSSPELAKFLENAALKTKAISFLIGGPEGLSGEVINKADFKWSLGKLTLPHDLAMIVTLEALYRASTINSNTPYHK
jgi:23S rRNA (pseudouridine1915-N3)-methyltransferase